MPVYLNGDPSSHRRFAETKRPGGRSTVRPGDGGRRINIGLLNNMSDGALEATERQFLALLDAAADGIDVVLWLYALPEIPRNDAGRRRVDRFYSGVENLWTGKLDGLIVTGREPRTPNLTDEPYYETLTKVLEWASENTHSTIWSCLAAHAAIRHLDGIERHRSQEKRSGVLDCVRLSDHHLMSGMPQSIRMPHSRWNDIRESDLEACGYTVLTRAQDAGVDTFIKRRNSLFVFFQGHPEYESDTLLTEYVRDVGRYLRGESGTYPSLPRGYFDDETADALTALSEKAGNDRRVELLEDVAAAVGRKRTPDSWHSAAARIYGNWLNYIGLEKHRRLSLHAVGVNGTMQEMALPGL